MDDKPGSRPTPSSDATAGAKAIKEMKEAVVHLRCDANEALAAIAVLRTALEIGPAGDVSQRILDTLKRPEEVFRIKTDIHSTGARTVTVRLEPSDSLAMLLAALRAGNVDQTSVEEI